LPLVDKYYVRQFINIVESANPNSEDDPRYQNDGITRDPDHPLNRTGHWGSSHHASYQIAGHSAMKMGATGYQEPHKDKVYARLSDKKLAAIFASSGAKEPLYHGFQNLKHIEWKIGEVLTIPLMATSGELQGSAGYGVRVDPADNKGPPTVFEFPKGTRMFGYGKWDVADAKDFGHLWMEAIVAGKFRIIGVRQVRYEGTWRKNVFLTVVRLEPVAYFDPDTDEWDHVS
jgi:hypothetical protein